MDLSYVSMLLNWTVYVCSIILCNSFTIYLTDLFDVSILCFLLSFVAIICQTKTSWCNSFTMPIFQVERQAVRGTSRKSRRAMAMIGSFPSMSSILSGSDALTGWGGLWYTKSKTKLMKLSRGSVWWPKEWMDALRLRNEDVVGVLFVKQRTSLSVDTSEW